MDITTPTPFVANLADRLMQIADTTREANRRADNALKPTSSLDYIARSLRDIERAAKPTRHQRCDVKEHEQHPITDLRLYALWLANGQVNTYDPGAGSRQVRFLTQLALDFYGYADPGKTLLTLVSLAVWDRTTALERAEADIAAQREQIAAQLAQVEPLQTELAAQAQRADLLDNENRDLKNALADTSAQLAHERRITMHVVAVNGEDHIAPDQKPPKSTRKPVRTLVEGETGIYQRAGGDLEITWKRDGTMQYERLPGADLAEARAIREQRIAEAAEAQAA